MSWQDSKDRNMRNLKLIISYDGSDFSGWQVQPDAVTVQGTLASAIGRITGEKVLPQGSGRTDAGVHALAQVLTFATESSVPTANFLTALNDILPPTVRVLEADEAPADFHVRKSARAKTYRYRIYHQSICPPFLARYVWHYPYRLHEEAMGQAANIVIGEHDFTSFAAVDPERGRQDQPASNVRRIFSSTWERQDDAPHGEKFGGDIHSGRKGNVRGRRHRAHSGGAQPISRGSDGASQRTLSGQCGVLARTALKTGL